MSVKIDLAKKKITLGVGDLVAEPLAQAGRVAGISMWTRMALGRDAHTQRQHEQSWQHTGYARELAIKHRTTVDEFTVTVQGRIDGVYEPTGNEPWIVEEIKSVVLTPLVFAALQPDSHPQHAEQLRLYCYFVAGRERSVSGRLVYMNVADNTRKEFLLPGPFADCEQLIADRVRLLIDQAREADRQKSERHGRAGTLPFPHTKPRLQQDRMIAAVEHALDTGRHLMVSAPSGIGKTAGALYPVVKYAFANDKRVFFLTAKNTQHAIALETLRRMEAPSAVAFRAREKMCINQVYACREEFCPHLQMFKAKLERSQVLDRLEAQRLITPEVLMEAGRHASLCPFELALLEAERTDVIVCDYNYVFDPQVYFRRFFQDEDYSDAILVIDEAHNLLQRALDYYSPSLQRGQLRSLKHNLGHVEPTLVKEITRFLNQIDAFFREQSKPVGDEYSQLDEQERKQTHAEKFLIPSPRGFFDELKPAFARLSMRYMLDKLTSGRAIPDDPVDEFFGDYSQFCAVLAMDGEEFTHVFDTTNGGALKIVCMDPSARLAERLAGFHSVIAMSATLEPMDFYRQLLGFPPDRTDQLSLPSPFPSENRKIVVMPQVSTTFRYRAGNYDTIAEIITTTALARRGNYMALFPSYEFLRNVSERLPSGFWEILTQEARMTEERRQELLEALKRTETAKLVLAVQGGVFAEGVDYPGELLCGVIVVSPALPQVSFERELMRQYYEQHYRKGFEYAYLYPGMNRVIQSVGRLIRTETDRGVAVLICQRFAQTQYSSLFPPDWNAATCRDLETELQQFWHQIANSSF
jgi:DNA excision repair protein ERCC-2